MLENSRLNIDFKGFLVIILLLLTIFLSGFHLGFSEIYEVAELQRVKKGIFLSPSGNPFSWRVSYYFLVAGVLSVSLLANYVRMRAVDIVDTALVFASLFPSWTLFSEIPAAITGPERISPSDFSLVWHLEIVAFPLLVLLAILHLVDLFRKSGEDNEHPAIL